MTNSGAIFVHRQTRFKMHAGPLNSNSVLPEAVGLKKETGVCESLVSEWDAWGQTWEKLCVHGCTLASTQDRMQDNP